MTVLDPVWLGWIAATVAIFWLVPERWRPLTVAPVCAAFLVVYDLPSAFVLALMGLLSFHAGEQWNRRGVALAGMVVVLLGALAVCKVLVAPIDGTTAGAFAMPLGMSYYTFRCVHYLLERYKRALPPHTLLEFAAYLFFLPTLLAGPIHRFPEFHRDLRRAQFSGQQFSAGLERILYGYAKIVLLANYLMVQQLLPYAERVADAQPRAAAYLRMVGGGFNGYLQFAGYSDIAIGFALLLGFRVIENFNHPFLSPNISEFWRRWHISLSGWCRDYLYAGVFSLTRNPYLGAVVTLLAIGLWHEVSLRYVLWGLAHGVAVMLCQWFQRNRERWPLPAAGQWGATGRALATLVTFHFVMLSFVLVQNSLPEAIVAYRTLFAG